jgi:hypothetical protein
MKTALIPILVFLSAAAFSAPAKCQTADKAASKEAPQEPEIPKSISQSVAGTLQYAEGNILGLAEAMPEDKPPCQACPCLWTVRGGLAGC